MPVPPQQRSRSWMPGPKHFYTLTTAATTRTGALNVADMRMNGSCAGGTGSFIDEVASILQTPPEKMNELVGFSDVPLLTNDDTDFHNLHPGFRLSLPSALRIAYALPMIDILEELLRKIRPYELTKGSADAAFDQALDAVIDELAAHGVTGGKHGFSKAIEIMKQVPYDRSHPRPTVLIMNAKEQSAEKNA